MDYNKEEEQMVARVGGRGRSLVQTLIRVRRERAGRAPSKSASDSGYWNETTDTGGGSTWSGSREETSRTGKGEKKSDH